MSVSIAMESLKDRTHFAATRLDPNYTFSEPDVSKQVGHDVDFYQAVPAPGDRTYLLADKFHNDDFQPPGELVIVAVGANGKLDPAIGYAARCATGSPATPARATTRASGNCSSAPLGAFISRRAGGSARAASSPTCH